MAAEWRISAAQMVLVPALSQWGITISYLLLLPLADSLERRRSLAQEGAHLSQVLRDKGLSALARHQGEMGGGDSAFR
jgi:hypothetical protein